MQKGLTAQQRREAFPAGTAECRRDIFIAATGRELYHWLGFEANEARTASPTAAVVNSLPQQSWQPPFVLLQVAGCVFVAARASRELSPAVSLVTILTTYLLFDLYSGWVHYCLDWEGFNFVPLLGPLCRTFQHHHSDTTFIWRSNIWTNLSEVGLFVHISDTLPLALLCGYLGVHVPPIYWYCSAWKTLHSMIGELGHRAAHKPPTVRSGFERSMQRCGIFISPKYHLQGHHHNLDQQFCELGWMDPVFDAMRCVTTNRWAWAAFTFCSSFADTWLLGGVTMAVANAWA
eukprot:SAG31_NODE_362_length_16904_cov_7.893218_4_plen_290_part_00